MIRTPENLLKRQTFIERLRAVTPEGDILIGIFLSTFFINILGLVFPISLLIVYDRIIPHAALSTLTFLGIGVLIAISLEAILRISRDWISAWSDARFEHFASIQAIHHILFSKINSFEKKSPGVYLEYLNGIHVLKNFFGGQAIITLIDLPFIIIYLALIVYLAGPLVFIPIIMLIIFAWGTFIANQKIRAQLEERHNSEDKRLNYIFSVLAGIHTIKSMATEIPMQRRYERLQQASNTNNYELGLTGSLASVTGNLARNSTLVLVIGIGALSVMSHNLTIGGLAACVILAGRTLQPISRAVQVWTRLQDIKLAEDHLEMLSRLPVETEHELPLLPEIKGDVELQDLTFGYSDTSTLFNNLTLKVKQGEFIGIKGKNLNGKTTLMWLITGIIQPTTGKILIDGHNISEFDPVSVRRQIAYLPQKGVLFNASIIDNITMFKPELTGNAKKIAAKLGLDPIIQKLPKGYETMVGKYAVETISPGLKQTICIARALVEDPKVILFDEANRHLDHELDTQLKNLLEEYKHKYTIILVSNRPSLLSLADHIYHIEDKTIRKYEK